MAEQITNFFKLISVGMGNISLNKKRNYHRHIRKTSIAKPKLRWVRLGKRLINATNKVVEKVE